MITIIEDTRQQTGRHELKHEYFERKDINVVRSKLPAGDYALLTDMSRVVDTKQDLQEVYSNLIQDHERFRREADFCKDHGIKLTILVEETNAYTDKYCDADVQECIEYFNFPNKPVKTSFRCPCCGNRNILHGSFDNEFECLECGNDWFASIGRNLYLL